jgi:hypothetical protein
MVTINAGSSRLRPTSAEAAADKQGFGGLGPYIPISSRRATVISSGVRRQA